MAVGGELVVRREPFQRLALPDRVVALDQVQDLRLQHEEAAIDALAARLADALAVPVHVANDANTRALGEFTYGGAQDAAMVLTVGQGVGAIDSLVPAGDLVRSFVTEAEAVLDRVSSLR